MATRTELLQHLFREIAIADDLARERLAARLPAELPERQFELLNHLRFTTNTGETPGDLARLFRVSRPAMTQLLARMQRGGLVRLDPATQDRRVRHVVVTERGLGMHAEVMAALAEDLQEVDAALRGIDVEALVAALHTLRITLEARRTAMEETTT